MDEEQIAELKKCFERLREDLTRIAELHANPTRSREQIPGLTYLREMFDKFSDDISRLVTAVDAEVRAPSPLLSVKQASKFLDMSTRSILRAEDAGEFPRALSTPGGPRWRRDDILAWVKTLKPRRKKPRRRIIIDPPAPDGG